MGSTLHLAASFLTAPPGNLFYYLWLVLCIAVALQAAWYHLRLGGVLSARRSLLGLLVLLFLVILPFFINPAIWSIITDQRLVLPSLDRFATLIFLAWLAWLWIFPDRSPLADISIILFSIGCLVVLGISFFPGFQKYPDTGFNYSIMDYLWQIVSLFLIGLTLLLLLIRRKKGWKWGWTVFLLAGIGHVLYLSVDWGIGDYPGIIRLSQFVMAPMLLALPFRYSDQALARKADVPGQASKPEEEPKAAAISFLSQLDLAGCLELPIPTLSRNLSQYFGSDICAFLTLTDGNIINPQGGYDRILEKDLQGSLLGEVEIPDLSAAMQSQQALIDPAPGIPPGNLDWLTALGVSEPGSLLAVPIKFDPPAEVPSYILLASSRTRPGFSGKEQAELTEISAVIVPFLKSDRNFEKLVHPQDNAVSRFNEIQSQEMTSASSAQVIESDTFRQVGAPNVAAGQMDIQFRLILEELVILQNELMNANMLISQLETRRVPDPNPVDQTLSLASFSQELRQPMASIVGYTDMLLGESVGILGSMQRSFLERIKASTDRISTMIEEMTNTNPAAATTTSSQEAKINIYNVINNSLTTFKSEFPDKEETLELEIPNSLPEIAVDQETVQQVLQHLLVNASEASPKEGHISLRVRVQSEQGREFLLIQVVDSGGGIHPSDLPKVFARRYRTGILRIQGLGYSGLGLSIAKSLAEAQAGRIWIETTRGVGSTLSVLLPITPDQPTGDPPDTSELSPEDLDINPSTGSLDI